MSARLFPTISGDVCRRYVAIGRETPNDAALQLRFLVAIDRARRDGFHHLAAALIALLPKSAAGAAATFDALPVTRAPMAARAAGAKPGTFAEANVCSHVDRSDIRQPLHLNPGADAAPEEVRATEAA